MKSKQVIKFLISVMLLTGATLLQAEVRLWPVPKEEPVSSYWSVEVKGQSAGVLTARTADPPFEKYQYGGEYGFVSLDCDEAVSITIREKTGRSLDRLTIRPHSLGLTPKKNADGSFEVKVSAPCQFSVEVNGREHPLLVFVNPLEKNVPDKNNPNVIAFGPGIHEPKGGAIRLKDHQTLYLAPGAIVKCGIEATGSNITICGRGVIDSSQWQWRHGPTGHVVSIHESKNVRLEGVIIRGASHWTVVPVNSDDVKIENIKICGGRVQNDDGINPCNSRKVDIRNCFIRTDDDCIALKGLRNSYGNCEDITVENCVFWCDRARIVLMGHESRAPYMRRITFRNCDIIHSQPRHFLLEPGEEMKLEDLLFENIRFEKGEAAPTAAEVTDKKIDTSKLRFDIDTNNKEHWLFVAQPAVNQYMQTKVPGHISRCVIRNITAEGTPVFCGILFAGKDSEHRTVGVTLENIDLFGKKLTEKSPELNIGSFVDSVIVK